MEQLSPQELFTTADQSITGRTILDVRSPQEYAEGHLPGAKSLPLFTDEERAEVGTLYKQTSPDAALLRGLEIAGAKMRALVETARKLAPDNRVIVHCWRGGQRSGSVGWLLERAGMDVLQLTGGYKQYRTYVRNWLSTDHHEIVVLSGPTGSGKTPVLLALRELGEYVIDLEGLAHHKGSSFGALGEKPQPSTEEFENLLFAALRDIPPGSRVWFEDESRMIGTVYQPDGFYERLVAAPVVEMQQPSEWRIEHLVANYASYPREDLEAAFVRIRKKLGGQHLSTALGALDKGDYAAAARVALVYYDKAYAHYGERRNADVVATIIAASRQPEDVAAQLRRWSLSFAP